MVTFPFEEVLVWIGMGQIARRPWTARSTINLSFPALMVALA
jgi:hypothetical protein